MKQCEHGECSFENRFEYCESGSKEWEAVLSDAVEFLDIFIQAELPQEGEYGYRNGIAHRSLTYRSVEPQDAGKIDIRHAFSVYHEKLLDGGDSYGIRTSWYPESADPQLQVETNFLIEDYAHSPAQTSIWEPDIMNGKMVGRPMTLYDFKTLLNSFESLLHHLNVHANRMETN